MRPPFLMVTIRSHPAIRLTFLNQQGIAKSIVWKMPACRKCNRPHIGY